MTPQELAYMVEMVSKYPDPVDFREEMRLFLLKKSVELENT
jgi:hypothetical protein